MAIGDPFAGVSTGASTPRGGTPGPQQSRDLMAAATGPMENLDDAAVTQRAIDMMAGTMGDVGMAMPELMMQAAGQPGATMEGVMAQFEGTQSALELEQQAMLLESQLAQIPNWKDQREVWDRLNPQLREALKLQGFEAPSAPANTNGGIDIPFTSALKKVGNALIPFGSPLGDGDIEVRGGDTDGFTNFVNATVQGAASPIRAVGGAAAKGVGGLVSAVDWASRTAIERPAEVGQMVREGMFGEGSGGVDAQGQANTIASSGIANTVGNFGFAVAGLFTGRSQEYWQLTTERGATFRPGAIDDALEMLDGDIDKHALALALLANNNQLLPAVEEVTGAKPGETGFNEAYTMLLDLTNPEEPDEAFNSVMEMLSLEKVGLGHDVMEQLGVQQGDRGHNLGSAYFEMATLSVLDPTLVLGKANRIRKMAQFAVDSGELGMGLDRARRLAQVSRWERVLAAQGDDALDAATKAEHVLRSNDAFVGSLRDNRWAHMLTNDAKQIAYGGQVDAVMDRIARAADPSSAYTFSNLIEDVPQLKGIRSELVHARNEGVLKPLWLVDEVVDDAGTVIKQGVRDTDGIWEYFSNGVGFRSLNSSALGRDPRLAVLPRIGAHNSQWAASKQWWKRKMDLSATAPGDVLGDLTRNDELDEMSIAWTNGTLTAEEGNQAARKWLDNRNVLNLEGIDRSNMSRSDRGLDAMNTVLKIGRNAPDNLFGFKPFINRFTKHVPRQKNIETILGTTPELMNRSNMAILDFERLVEFGDTVRMSTKTKQRYVDLFTTGNQGQRMTVVRQFQGELIWRTGMLDDVGKGFSGQNKNAADLLGEYAFALDQHFSIGADQVVDVRSGRLKDIVSSTAIWDTQLADSVSIMDWKEFRRGTAKTNLLRTFGGGGYHWVDAQINRFWKPSVLMRLGFLPRAAGEETLSYILRLGGTSYARSQFGRRYLYGQTIDQVSGLARPVQELNATGRRMQQLGLTIQRMARTSEAQTQAYAKIVLKGADRARFTRLERLALVGGTQDEIVALQAEMTNLLQPVIAQYLSNRGRTTALANGIASRAITNASRVSEGMWSIARSAKLPSRQMLGEKILGVKHIGTSANGLPMFANPSRANLFGAWDQNAGRYAWGDQVDGEALVLAETWMANNGSVQAIRARGLGSSFNQYGTQLGQETVTNLDHLSTKRQWKVKQSRSGNMRIVPSMKSTNKWVPIDQIEGDARIAIGNAMTYPANDRAFTQSGAIDALNGYVSPSTLGVLDEGDDITTLKNARLQLAENLEEDKVAAAEWRYALSMGEELPTWEGIDNLALNRIIGAANKEDNRTYRLKGLLYPDEKMLYEPLSTSLDDTMQLVRERMGAYMQRPDYQPELASMMQMAARNGTPLVAPLPPNMTRLYGVSVRPSSIEQLRKMATNPEVTDDLRLAVALALESKGLPANEVDNILFQLLGNDGLADDWLDLSDRMARTGKPEDFVPGANLLFADPQVAADVSDAFQDAMVTINKLAPSDNPNFRVHTAERYADVGYIDLDNGTLRNPGMFTPRNAPEAGLDPRTGKQGEARWDSNTVFELSGRGGPDLGAIDEFRRIDRDRMVSFAETSDGGWIGSDVLATMDELDRPELTGNLQWAQGMTEHAARLDLVQARIDGVAELLITSEGDVLNEIMGHMKGGTFDPTYHMLHVPVADLPQEMYVPEMVDIKTWGFDRMVGGFFSEVVNPVIDGVVRTQAFAHNMASTLPMAAEYYHMGSKGPRNTRILGLFEEMGYELDEIDRLLFEVHAGLGVSNPGREPSDMGDLLDALMDPKMDPERATIIFNRAMNGGDDGLRNAAREMSDQFMDDELMRNGANGVDVVREADLEAALAEEIGQEFRTRDELVGMIDELEGEVGFNQALLDGADQDEVARLVAAREKTLAMWRNELNKPVNSSPAMTQRVQNNIDEQMAAIAALRREQDPRTLTSELIELSSEADSLRNQLDDIADAADNEFGQVIAAAEADRLALSKYTADELEDLGGTAAVYRDADDKIANLKRDKQSWIDERSTPLQQHLDNVSATYSRDLEALTPSVRPRVEAIAGANSSLANIATDQAGRDLARTTKFDELKWLDVDINSQKAADSVDVQERLVEVESALADQRRRLDWMDNGEAYEEALQAQLDELRAGESVHPLMRRTDGANEENLNWHELQKWAQDRSHRMQEAMEQAAIRATDMTVEFIDDHRFRSQFQQTVGNLMPFWFAEEQFVKRQVRMVVDSPESIRRASLLMQAARHSGVIDTDAEGNEIFVYPGSQTINEVLMRTAGMVTGVDGLHVFAEPMTAQVQYMLPGYGSANYMVEGGTGPFMGFSMAFITGQFPELEPLDRLLNRNEIAQGKKPWEHFYPPVLNRLFGVVGIEALDGGRMQSAQQRAIQMSAVAGNLPGQRRDANGDLIPATQGEKDRWLDQIRNHARIINAMDTVLYLAAPLPAGAAVRYGDMEVSDAFSEIVFESGLPYQEGVAKFLELYPDSTPFTVFGTQSTTGAPIGTDHDSVQWLNDNQELLTDFPIAAAYLMPTVLDNDDDAYSRRARREQMEMDLRTQLTPEEFMDEIIIQGSSTSFYETSDRFHRAIYEAEEAGDKALAKELEVQRRAWVEGFNNMNPTFASDRAELGGAQRRLNTQMQRDAILALPRDQLPEGQHTDDILELMTAHAQFNAAMKSMSNDQSAETVATRRALRTEFLVWAASFSANHVTTEPYFSSNIRWDKQITDGGESWMIEIEEALGRDL